MLSLAVVALLLPLNTAAAAATPATAGARSALMLTMRYEMQCGKPGPGPVVVSLPPAERVPHAITRATVRVDAKAPRAVSVSGHTVTIALVRPHGITCMEIGPGTLTVSFTRAAGLGNPAAAGSYRVGIRVGTRTFGPRFAVHKP